MVIVLSPLRLKALALMVVTVLENRISFKALQFSKAQLPMVVTPFNRVTFLRLVQLLNRLPLSVLGPKVTSSKFSQFSKTQSPKSVTLLGREAEVRLLHLEKA